MPRGGYRPGSGRKKGSKDKPRESIAFILKARELADFYLGMVSRAKQGVKPSVSDKEKLNYLIAEMAGKITEKDKPGEIKAEDHLPLDYMLKVMNDPLEDKELRARMAQAAAPYCHDRKGEGKGKKDEREEKAKRAGEGKFSPSKPPLALVK
jgi:phage terminase small subunit